MEAVCCGYDDDSDEGLLLLLAAAYFVNKQRRKRKYAKRCWVQVPNLLRATHGGFAGIFEIYKQHHPSLYRNSLRMDPSSFEKILNLIRTSITKTNTAMREAIPPEQRLAVTLIFLATGDSIKLIAMFFRMGVSTVRKIVYATCTAIWQGLKDTYLTTPSTVDEWNEIISE